MIDEKQFFAGLLASLLLASTPLPAQEVAQEAGKDDAQKAEESVAAEEQAAKSEQKKSDTPGVERNETFVPSEKISSDNSISFPVDI